MSKKTEKPALRKEHLEILLEDIQDKVQSIAEGHIVLNNKIDTLTNEFRSGLQSTREELVFLIKTSIEHSEERLTRKLSLKIDEVKDIVKVHTVRLDDHEGRLTWLEHKN